MVAPGDVERVRAFCREDRISGLLAAAVAAGEVIVEAGGPGIDDDWHDALHGCVLLEAMLVRVAERLDDAGVRWMLTKGPAVAHLDYEDVAERTFADVDLIVHPDDWELCASLLATDRPARPWHDRYVRRFGKGITTLVDDMEVDLHLRYAVGRFGLRCRTADCFDGAGRMRLANRDIPVPARAQRLLHACHHAVFGGNRELRAFRDVAQIALASPDDLDAAWEIARRWNVEAVVATAIEDAWERLRLPADLEVLAAAKRVEIGRGDARALRVFERRSAFRPQALTALTELPWRRRPDFVRTSWMMSRERRR